MHVIICAEFGGPYGGSFVPMLVAVAREAEGRGYPTSVLLPGGARERAWVSELAGVAEVSFGSNDETRLARMRAATAQFRAAIARHPGPAVIHSHFDSSDIPAALMRLRRRRVAVFWHAHNPVRESNLWRFRTSLRLGVFGQLVNEILCVSEQMRDDLRARLAPRRKLRVFPNAVDTDAFTPPTAADRIAARRALELPEDARVVLHFGWSWYRKGGDLMLAAGELLADEPGVMILTVLSEDDAASHALATNPVVRALAPTNDVKRLYAAADVFLSSSRAEGAPLALLEAMSSGLRVVVTDIPVQQRLVAGLPGAAVVKGDSAAIAAGIKQVLAMTEDDRVRHVELVRAMLEGSYSLTAWARRLVDLYEEALGTK